MICGCGLLIFAWAIFALSSGESIKGVVKLDEVTFDKVVPRHKYVLVKFDELYPQGERQAAFKKLAAATEEQDDLLLVEMNLDGHSNEDSANGKIAKRYRIDRSKYPVYRLFVQSKNDPVSFKGTPEFNDLRRFIVEQTDLWLDLPGCLKSFNKYAQEFADGTDAGLKKAVLDKAKRAAKDLSKKKERKLAEIYIDTMVKLLASEGGDFLKTEIRSVSNAAKEVAKEKKTKLKKKLDVLYLFKYLMNRIRP